MQYLKDILIEAGSIDKYYEKFFPVNVWRAKNLNSKGGIFELVEARTIRPNGKVRPTDISIDNRGGEPWVFVKDRPRGISTFDKPNVFKAGRWEYYRIPAGTPIPAGLAIVKDGVNAALGAVHYTIAPQHDMPLRHFKNLLGALANQLVREFANGNK